MYRVCSYQDCYNTKKPCSSISFFSLPKDKRRKIWITNSGSESLKNISDKSLRFFCEQHFNPKDIRRQSYRATLNRYAEPFKYVPKRKDLNSLHKDNIINEQIEIEKSTNLISNNFESSNIIIENLHGDSNELWSNAIIIEDTINESNDEIKIQLDCPVRRINETVEINENTNCGVDEKLANHNNSEADVDIIDQIEVNNNISHIEKPDELNKNLDSHEKVQDNNDYENDKHFALSLVGNFQRLSEHKKAVAKIKILQYLTELEFSEIESPNNITIK